RLLDDFGDLGIEAADPRIHPRGRLLDEAERMDDLERHLLARAERKILDRALGLGAPIGIARDFDRPEAVALGTGVVGHDVSSIAVNASSVSDPVIQAKPDRFATLAMIGSVIFCG